MSSDTMWIVAAGIAGVTLVLLAWMVLGWRRSHRYTPARPVQTGSGDTLTGVRWQDIRSLQDILDRQARQVQELRTRCDQRFTTLEQRMDTMERAARGRSPEQPGALARPGAERAPYAAEPFGYGVDTIGYGAPAETGRRPGPGDLPVEVRDGAVVTSDALPPTAFVVSDGAGRGRVFLNPEVQLNEFALPKWEEFFELRGRQPYASYRTVRPAEVSWDSTSGRGALVTMGMAEPL